MEQALYNELEFWLESQAQDNEKYFNIDEDKKEKAVEKTICDSEFIEAMHDCFSFYINH